MFNSFPEELDLNVSRMTGIQLVLFCALFNELLNNSNLFCCTRATLFVLKKMIFNERSCSNFLNTIFSISGIEVNASPQASKLLLS